jgi:hypothetical protein
MHDRFRLSYLTLLILALACLWLAGCASGGEGILLEDRFGNPDGAFGSDSQRAFDRGYQDGHYFIEVYEPNWFIWARPEERFADVDIQVEARWVSGSPQGHFGLLCRYRSPDDFYYFAITADGFYAILRVEDGTQDILNGEAFLPSTAILTGDQTNIVRAICHRNELSLYVNGQHITTVNDDRFRRGDVALAVGSGANGATRVHFDNMVVTGPDY